MDEVISKLAAIDALGEAPEVWMDTPEEFAALNQWEYDVAAIKAVPSVQRKKGKWNAHKDCEGKTRRITCNLCGWQSHSLCWYDYNYCPNCGADMRGKNNE